MGYSRAAIPAVSTKPRAGASPRLACPRASWRRRTTTAHDVGDPWNSQAYTRAGFYNDWQAPNISNGCSGDTRWMVKMSSYDSRHGGWKDGHVPIYPGTSHLVSSVHPRTKKFVGERLAQAA